MGPDTATPVTTGAELPGQSDRRHSNRTPALFSLLYSSMSTGQILIGDGIVTNLSPIGIDIRGNRSVTPGMEMALLVDLPGLDEPLCIVPSRVSWVAGHRFGVEMGTLKLEEKGGDVTGEHKGEFLAGNIRGSRTGDRLSLRSSHRFEGTSVTYRFDGVIASNAITGTVDLAEYGKAQFTARRHA